MWPDTACIRPDTPCCVFIEIDKLSAPCLALFIEMNKREVKALSIRTYRLEDPELLRRLMRRTGDGRAVSIRGLAEAAHVHHSTIGHLLTGEQETASGEVAQAISDRIGVDLGVLWIQDGRTARSLRRLVVTA